jgi:hypothetical protein
MKIRVIVFGLAACGAACAAPLTASGRIFPMVFITTNAGRTVVGAASPSPFGGKGTIDESTHYQPAEQLVQSLAMPLDIAASDNIVYAVIGNKGIITAFSAKTGEVINNGNDGEVATVPKGKPVGIAAFGGNVFVADSSKSKITEYNSGGTVVASFSKDVNHPREITAAEGNLFVVNQGGKIGEYITEYDAATGQKVPGNLIQGLKGPIQIAVDETDLFILSNNTIRELDLTTHQLTPFISGLNGATDIAALGGQLFVTDVPNHSVDVYDIATGNRLQALTITGLHGRPQGIDVVPAPDQSSTLAMLLLGLIATFGLKVILRQPA